VRPNHGFKPALDWRSRSGSVITPDMQANIKRAPAGSFTECRRPGSMKRRIPKWPRADVAVLLAYNAASRFQWIRGRIGSLWALTPIKQGDGWWETCPARAMASLQPEVRCCQPLRMSIFAARPLAIQRAPPRCGALPHREAHKRRSRRSCLASLAGAQFPCV